VLYALTRGDLHVLPLTAGKLAVTSTINAPGQDVTSAIRQRLFVGADRAYSNHRTGINTFDLSDPLNPVHLVQSSNGQFGWKQLVDNGSGLGVVALGNNSTSDGPHGIDVFSLDGGAVEDADFVSNFPTTGYAGAVTIFNGIAYVADGAAGLQVINYQAFDNLGVAPSSVTLSTSLPGNTAEEGSRIALTATAVDDLQIRNLEFFVDGDRIVTDGNFPFRTNILVPALADQATVTLQARASDTGGNATFSSNVVLTITADVTQPTVLTSIPAAFDILGSVRAVSVTFSEAVDPDTLTSIILTTIGPDQIHGTGDDVTVTPDATDYVDSTHSFIINFDTVLATDLYRLTVPATVTDNVGNSLQSAYVADFQLFELLDLDRDGIPDDIEATLGLSNEKFDTDGDGLPDGDEDFDSDNLTNSQEVVLGTNPALFDTDGDGTSDGNEDRDGDGVTDSQELADGTNLNEIDTDSDGVGDLDERDLGSDPLDAASRPAITVAALNVTYHNQILAPADQISTAHAAPVTFINIDQTGERRTPISGPMKFLNTDQTGLRRTPISGPTKFLNLLPDGRRFPISKAASYEQQQP
jgi:hypothetical protein